MLSTTREDNSIGQCWVAQAAHPFMYINESVLDMRSAYSRDSLKSAPTTITVAPNARQRVILTSGAITGTTTVTGTPVHECAHVSLRTRSRTQQLSVIGQCLCVIASGRGDHAAHTLFLISSSPHVRACRTHLRQQHERIARTALLEIAGDL